MVTEEFKHRLYNDVALFHLTAEDLASLPHVLAADMRETLEKRLQTVKENILAEESKATVWGWMKADITKDAKTFGQLLALSAGLILLPGAHEVYAAVGKILGMVTVLAAVMSPVCGGIWRVIGGPKENKALTQLIETHARLVQVLEKLPSRPILDSESPSLSAACPA